MALSTDELDTINRLRTRIVDCSYKMQGREAYYDGQARMEALGLSLPPEMRQLLTVVNWPRLCVDSLEHRLDVEGFRLAGVELLDDRLWSWWQDNNLDEESSMGHTEAFVQGRAYVTVGPNDEDKSVPSITVESARGMAHEVDPRTRKIKNVLRLYNPDPASGQARSGTLYTPNERIHVDYDRGRWVETDRVVHNLNRVTVVPLVNRARIHDREGRSEMADVIPLTDAACRALTNLQGAQELLAVPTRYVMGAEQKDFVDQSGNAVPKWEAYMGRFNTMKSTDAKVVQLAAADLRNFTDTINFYAKQVAAVAGLPAKYLGHSSDANPSSGDAIRQEEGPLVKRAERKIKGFSGAWEEVMRLALLVVDGELPAEAGRLESVWREPSTPTYSSKADAVMKLASVQTAQGPLLPREAAWEELGFSKEKRRRYAEMSSDDPVARLASMFGNELTGMSTGAA